MDKIKIREITLFGVLGAMTFAAKYVMAVLPNVEPVSLCVMLYVVIFGKKAVYPIYLYVLMELLFFGIGTWNIMYLYIWGILALAAYCCRGMESPLSWALLSGSFGLLFGAFCAPVDAAIGGVGYAISKWMSGIPFDILHCIGNFAMALVLFKPMRRLLKKLYRQ